MLLQITDLTVLSYFYFRLHFLQFYLIFTSDYRSYCFFLFLLQITDLTVLFYFYFRLQNLLFYLIFTSDYRSYCFILFLLQITDLTVLSYFYTRLQILLFYLIFTSDYRSYCFIFFSLEIIDLRMLSGFTPNSKSFTFTKSNFLIIPVNSYLKSCCLWVKIWKHFYFSENLVFMYSLVSLCFNCHI